MIQTMNFLHYLHEDTYRDVCRALGLDETKPREAAVFENQLISKVSLYHIAYEKFGHIWFLDVRVDCTMLAGVRMDFAEELYTAYHMLFGPEAMAKFETFNDACCNYIEYANRLAVASVDETLASLRGICAPEQLDAARWYMYKKPNATIEFCLCKESETSLRTLARCHGTALKKRVKDETLHRTVGIKPVAALNEATERDIFAWLCQKHGLDVTKEML